MKERDYIKKRQELQSDYKKKIEALETVWKLFNPDSALPYDSDLEDESGSSFGWTFEISKKRAVEQASLSLEGDFSVQDVRLALTTMNPAWSNGISDNQLSSIVARAAALGKLEVLKSKVGRSQAIYRRADPARISAISGEDDDL